ncbi:MAG: hypothetical protein ACON5F_03360 [Jejuia sp.]
MDTPSTLLKSTALSFVIFWSIILTEIELPLDAIPYMFLSLIPIFLCCMFTICLTIAPFYWAKNEKTAFKTIYNNCFPFYAVALFGVCFLVILTSNFDTTIVAFISSAFFTLLKSWSWIIKSPKTELNEAL